jgi:sialidase-1
MRNKMNRLSKIILIVSFSIISLSCTDSGEQVKPPKPVIVWRQSDSGYELYRIPSLIVTQKGTVLAFCEGRQGQEDSGDIDLVVKRSSDNGKTWSEQSVVWSDGGNTCGNPCPVIDQTTGRIILMMTWNLGSEDESDIIKHNIDDTRRPHLCYSDDDGLTWSEPVDLTETCKNPDWGWYATGPGIAIQLKSEKYKNRIVIPANHSYTTNKKEEQVTDGGYGYGSHVLLSDDSGANWRMSSAITPGCNESQVVELRDGRLIMNMRSYNRMGCRAISYSQDGGETWSDIKHALQLADEVCQASFIEYGTYAGKKMYLFSNPGNPVDRYFMTIKTSFDYCETWSNDKLIFAGPSAYSCMTVLPDGNIGLLFEGGKNYRYESLVFVSIHPDQLFEPGTLLDNLYLE